MAGLDHGWHGQSYQMPPKLTPIVVDILRKAAGLLIIGSVLL